MKIDRLLSIVVYLLNRDKVSARVLSERFSVSIRTIQRDMDAINLAGIPVVSEQGPAGGYGIMDSFKLDRRLVTDDDLFFIMTALGGIDSSLDDARIAGTLEKIRGLVPASSDAAFRARRDKLFVDFSMLGGGPTRRETFRTVQAAVEAERLLSFEYTSNRLERIERVVEPMTIVFKWRDWYLFGYCRLREGYRLFRVSRIRNASMPGGRFSRRGLSFEDFERDNDPAGGGPLIEMTLRFSAEMAPIVEEFYSEADSERLSDGRLVVKARLPDEGSSYGYVLSFGPHVEVIGPANVRARIKEAAKGIYDSYE